MSTTALRTPKDVQALRARIASLPAVRAKIAKRAAEEFSKLAREDFEAQRSPDGAPWKSSKQGKTPTLKKSGALEEAATKYTAEGASVRASALSVRYAKYQLTRNFIPKDLPAPWLKRLREIATEEITKHLAGTR